MSFSMKLAHFGNYFVPLPGRISFIRAAEERPLSLYSEKRKRNRRGLADTGEV